MSTSASIDILCDYEVDFLNLLQGFITTGWNFNNHGKITYLGLNGDEGDWEHADLENEATVFEIIKKKMSLEEPIGIAVLWEDSMIGGLLVLYPDNTRNSISFLATINRQPIQEKQGLERATNFTWYVECILPAIREQRISIYGIETSDFL